jgi:plastocyanin
VTSNPTLTRKIVLILAAVALLPLLSGKTEGRNAQSVEMEEMRREIRLLRTQVQALRAAMSEVAELDRQKGAVLARVLKGIPGGSESASGSTKGDPGEQAPSASSNSDTAPAGPVARRQAASPPPVAEVPVGAIRGKVAVPSGEPVAYVYVENVLAPAVKGQRVVIEQKGKKFIPSWAVIQRGTAITFPNLDNIYHNVFSLSSGNSFDLGLYNSANDSKSHVFNEPGAVDIYCNIHPEMAASALVVPNRYYAKVKSDGSFEINNVPRGKRKVVAWAPGAQLTADWTDVEAGRTAEVSLKLVAKGSGHLNKSGQKYGSYE